MKLMITTLLFMSSAFAAETNDSYIVDCKREFHQAVLDIAFQNKENLGYFNRKTLGELLDHPQYITKVLIADRQIVGFITFVWREDTSLDEFIQHVQDRLGFAPPRNQIAGMVANNTHVKKTLAECRKYVRLEALAIKESFQKKGLGTLLLAQTMISLKDQCPSIALIELDIDNANNGAKEFFTSMGFARSERQPAHAFSSNSSQYEYKLY